MGSKDQSIKELENIKNKDNFMSDGLFYQGVTNSDLKSLLNTILSQVIDNFIEAVKRGDDERSLLKLLAEGISCFKRDFLETEDAERVGTVFEEIMDCIGLESSEGILNDWMYGEDIVALLKNIDR